MLGPRVPLFVSFAIGLSTACWQTPSAAEDLSSKSSIRAVSIGRPAGKVRTSSPADAWQARPDVVASADAAPDSKTSTVSLVSHNAPPAAPAKHWVRQATYEASQPVAAAPSQSSITLEPIAQRPGGPQTQSTAPQFARAQNGTAADGELPVARPTAAWPNPPARPAADAQLSPQTRAALEYFGGSPARATLSQLPRRAPIQAATNAAYSPARQSTKPFQEIQPAPTVSPYLNLHRSEDDSEGAPNYYAFVRPQLQQMEAARQQQLEIERLQRQVRGGPDVNGMQRSPTSLPPGTPTRFMDTARYYGAWQR